MGTRIVARPPDVCARMPYSPRMADRLTPASTDSPEVAAVLARAVDAILARCGKEIAVAASLGLGKPHRMLNALYDRASEASRRLRGHTAIRWNRRRRTQDWNSVTSAPSWPATSAPTFRACGT